MDFEKKILVDLLEKFYSSKKDNGTNIIDRRIILKPDKIYNKYSKNDGEYEIKQTVNETVKSLIKQGYIFAEYQDFSCSIVKIILNDLKIKEIEEFLCKKYSYESKDSKLNRLKTIIGTYKDASPICEQECLILEQKLRERKVPKDLDGYDDILKAIAFIENNNEELFIKEASDRIYHDTHYLEDKVIDSVRRVLEKYNNSWDTSEYNNDILHVYHIHKLPQTLKIKGNVILTFVDKTVDVSLFSGGVEFLSEDIQNITRVQVLTKRFMTIENPTSYYRLLPPDTTTFSLEGFANQYQREFLKKICSDNPEVEYLHFGDIDAGGFRIHKNICDFTGVHFSMFSMSVAELTNANYKSSLHKLTNTDVERLNALKEIIEYESVVQYMLDHNVKLEQEIISYTLSNHHL